MKNELREIAKECLVDALSSAYYRLTDGDTEKYNQLTENEKAIVLALVDKYGTAMCKAVGKNYYTV